MGEPQRNWHPDGDSYKDAHGIIDSAWRALEATSMSIPGRQACETLQLAKDTRATMSGTDRHPAAQDADRLTVMAEPCPPAVSHTRRIL